LAEDSTLLPNVAEITLLGTGGGYGESIVIHLGAGEWVIVDSCINPFTKEALPIEYLLSIGVDLKSQVKMVICTHWHEDHIMGISRIYEICESAVLSFARTIDKTKFLQFVSLDYEKLGKEASNSSTIEFNKCLELAKKKGPIKEASIDKILYHVQTKEFRSKVIALSPSDYSIEKFNDEISSLITDFGPINKKIVVEKPNFKSIVLLMKLGPHRALLGADLEVGKDPQLGWQNIMKHSTFRHEKSSLFKIPHHGSENSYHKDMWTILMSENPVSALTPFNKGNGLPELHMLNKFSNHTKELYLTSRIISKSKPKKRDRSIEKFLNRIGKAPQEVKFGKGVIQNRIDLTQQNDTWETKVFEEAWKV